MVTNQQFEYLQKILNELPQNNKFRFSEKLRDAVSLGLVEISEYEIKDASIALQSLLEHCKLINVIYDDFFNGLYTQYQSNEVEFTNEGRKMIESGGLREYLKNHEVETNQITRIDWVLIFFAKDGFDWLGIETTWLKIWSEYPTIYNPFIESYRQQIFDKLVKDGYLERDIERPDFYRVTFDGIVFSKKGGYNKDFSRKQEMDDLIRTNTSNQNELHKPLKTSILVGMWSNIITAVFIILTAIISMITCTISNKTLEHEYQKDTLEFDKKSLQKEIQLLRADSTIVADSIERMRTTIDSFRNNSD